MAEKLTTLGRSLLAQKQGTGNHLQVDKFILAYVPGQSPSTPIDPARGLPPANQIVHEQPVTKDGYMAPDMVVYSLYMDDTVGPFTFNTIYTVATAENNAVIQIITVPDTPKIATDQANSIRGQPMVRNAVLVYDDAAAITNITVEAEAWQFTYEEATESSLGLMFDAPKNEKQHVRKMGAWEEYTPPAEATPEEPGLIDDSPNDENVWGRYKGKWVKVWETGDVKMFSGTRSQIEEGWTLMDGVGTLSDGRNVPDISDRFVVASGDDYEVDATGGSTSNTTSTAGEHSHSISVGDTTLSQSQMPAHNHGIKIYNYSHQDPNNRLHGIDVGTSHVGTQDTNSSGGSSSHSHSGSSESSGDHEHTVDVTSPYYALAFIIKK